MLKVIREKYWTKEYSRAKNNFGIIVTNEHKTDNEWLHLVLKNECWLEKMIKNILSIRYCGIEI